MNKTHKAMTLIKYLIAVKTHKVAQKCCLCKLYNVIII